MHIIDLLNPDRVLVNVVARSKKRLLERVADALSGGDSEGRSRTIYTALCARERLGSTALGSGVAIPHGRLEEADEALGAFIRLRDPVDFEAPDQQPVDLFFGLIVPAHCHSEHLELLAQLAELFSDDHQRQHLRQAETHIEVLELLELWHSQRAV